MSRPSDLLVVVAVVAAVVWLGVPKLLLPALLLALGAVSVYRWRREGREPMAVERPQGDERAKPSSSNFRLQPTAAW